MEIKCFLPPAQVNESVLRPASVDPLSDLQLAEELIKQEMITMLHFDCLHHPPAASASQPQRSKSRGPASTSNNASHIAYLESHSYQPVSTEDMDQVTEPASVGIRHGVVSSCTPPTQLSVSRITINMWRIRASEHFIELLSKLQYGKVRYTNRSSCNLI